MNIIDLYILAGLDNDYDRIAGTDLIVRRSPGVCNYAGKFPVEVI